MQKLTHCTQRSIATVKRYVSCLMPVEDGGMEDTPTELWLIISMINLLLVVLSWPLLTVLRLVKP